MAHSIYYDWKVDFSENPSRTQGGIYSLYDLLILEDSEGVFRVRNADSITAIYLNHDIICHNSSIYDKKTGQPNRASGTFDVWAKLGIDVAPVQIDSRALLHKKTKNGNIVKYFSKDSVLKYSVVQEVMKAAAKAETNLTDLFISYDPDWKLGETKAYKGHSVASEKDVEITGTADIIVLEQDESFNLIYNSENTELTAYKKAFIKPQILKNILNYYIQEYQGFGFFRADDEINPVKADGILSAIDQEGKFEPGRILTLSEDASLIFEFLKNTFVFIRAPFFADYVQPEVFKQDLTEQSEVKHKNIIISGQGDFHRYSDDRSGSTKNTRFYHMQTAPTVDLLSKNYAKQVKINNYDNSNRKGLYDELFAHHELFGSALYDNRNTRQSDKNYLHDYLTSPQYFDPEVTQDYRGNDSLNSDLPVLIPEAGNLYIDGRILGPTIDEIWKYFKQIVSGTIASSEIDTKKDNGFTINQNYPCNESTTPEERKGVAFYRGYTTDNNGALAPASEQIIGDPIESEIKTHEQGFEYLDIMKWVTPPTHFKIQVYEFLKAANKEVMKGLKAGELETGYNIETLAPDSNSFSYEGHESLSPYKDKLSIYGPRENPYSLRELEAMLVNTKYNINALMSFLVKNYTVNGSLSHDKGGLFQFHKDYNSKIGDPNTLYKGSGVSAGPADIEDRDSLNASQSSKYGQEAANSSNNCTAKDVYLAADGTWRYVHQETRLRIFDTEF